jgi:energy-converting hydrogenase Eha subunit H
MADAPQNLAVWIIGVAISFIIVVAVVRGGFALKEEAYQKGAIVLLAAIVLIGFATLTQTDWQNIGEDFRKNVLKITGVSE